MIAAFLEWFLWLAAFCYCLWKAFTKAERMSGKFLAVIIGVAFVTLR